MCRESNIFSVGSSLCLHKKSVRFRGFKASVRKELQVEIVVSADETKHSTIDENLLVNEITETNMYKTVSQELSRRYQV